MRNTKKLKVGTKVKAIMGLDFGTGTIIPSFPWREATDGTFKSPESYYVPILWENGVKGFSPNHYLRIL